MQRKHANKVYTKPISPEDPPEICDKCLRIIRRCICKKYRAAILFDSLNCKNYSLKTKKGKTIKDNSKVRGISNTQNSKKE